MVARNSILQTRELYSDEGPLGFTLSLHVLKGGVALDWSELLTPESLWVCFNRSGKGMVLGNNTRLFLTPTSVGIFRVDHDNSTKATRVICDEAHSFITLELPLKGVNQFFGENQNDFHQEILSSLTSNKSKQTNFGLFRTMSLFERDLFDQLITPPVSGAALSYWYQAKVTEFLTLHLFRAKAQAEEPFCKKISRRQRVYVEKAILYLRDHLDQPLDLKEIAYHAGCAPHYLSRSFSEDRGKTLTRYLRELRIEKAAGLLRAGTSNVTEAAYEVGYQSLSHFTKAFLEEKGMKPSEFLKSK